MRYDSADTESSVVLTKCNIPTTITTISGNSISFPTKLSELNSKLITTGVATAYNSSASDISTTDTKVAAFETINGESIAVFYNLNCKNDTDSGPNRNEYNDWFLTQNRMCVNFVYDLNGLKGPNKVGKDIGFITALYAKNPEVVAPMPYATDIDGTHSQQDAIDKCLAYSDDSRLPNKHELSSIFYNINLVGSYQPGVYWSSSVVSSSRGWDQGFHDGGRGRSPRSAGSYVRCIRK